jgi:hypothetical protein
MIHVPGPEKDALTYHRLLLAFLQVLTSARDAIAMVVEGWRASRAENRLKQ